MQRWYVVFSKPRQEAVALENLERQAFEAWLPRARITRRHRGRWIDHVEPLFPRYLFVHVDVDTVDISPIRSTRGCTGLVRVAGHPAPVPEPVMDWLRATAEPDTGLHALGRAALGRALAKRLNPGDPVRVLEGPFEGAEGILECPRGADRAIVLLRILNDACRVTVPATQLARIESVASGR